MKKYLEILKKCPLFFGIDENNLLIMLNCLGARLVSFDKKYTIFAEGKPTKFIGIVLKGSAQIMQVDYYGNRSILSSVGPAEMFAEEFACSEVDLLPVTVVAAEPSEILLIDSGHILHACQNNCGFHQRLIFNLMKGLAEKTIMFHQKIEVTSKRTTREKLMTYLMLEAKKTGKNSFEVPFDRQELADYLEVDRSGLSVEISKLRDEGVLESRKKQFKLL